MLVVVFLMDVFHQYRENQLKTVIVLYTPHRNHWNRKHEPLGMPNKTMLRNKFKLENACVCAFFFLCSFVNNFGSIYFYTISIQPNLQTDPSLSGKKPTNGLHLNDQIV